MALAGFSASASRGVFPPTSTQTPPRIPRRSMQACLSSKPSKPSVGRSLLGLRDPPALLGWTRRSAGRAAPRCCTHSSGDGEGDRQPLENVLKLYTAMKDGSAQKITDLIGSTHSQGAGEGGRRPLETVLKLYTAAKEGNFPFPGPDSEVKKRGQQLFSSLMGLAGNNVDIVIKPTKHEGTNVGVAWRLEWKKTYNPMGGDSTFRTVHHYQGKMFLRNVEMLVQPIIYIHLLGRRLVENLRSALDQINVFKENRKAGFVSSLVLLLLMAFSFMVIKKFHH